MQRWSSTLGLLLALGAAAVHSQIAPGSTEAALSAGDYLEIEQLVYKYGWALDSGENNGFSYADLYASDGTFTGTNQGRNGRNYQGRENLAALARGSPRGPFNVSHIVANLIVTPTPDGALGRVYVGILDPGQPGASPGAGNGGFYDDVYVKTSEGWRFKSRTFFEGKWGEPNVPVPPPVPGVRALRDGMPGPSVRERDHLEIQQLVARLPYGVDMNADDGASYASGFTPDGTFACVLPDGGTVVQSGLLAGCVPHSGAFTSEVRPRARGREALARMTLDEPHGPAYVRHFVFNHVIELNSSAASGKAYVAIIDIMPRQQGSDHSILMLGRYDDDYVKTAQGWRIESRVFTVVAGGAPSAVSP